MTLTYYLSQKNQGNPLILQIKVQTMAKRADCKSALRIFRPPSSVPRLPSKTQQPSPPEQKPHLPPTQQSKCQTKVLWM